MVLVRRQPRQGCVCAPEGARDAWRNESVAKVLPLADRGGRRLIAMLDDAADRFSTLVGGRDGDATTPGLLTIAQVADAARLPQPVVAQLVSRARVWVVNAGWMYTAAAPGEAVRAAAELRGAGARPRLEVLDGLA